MSKFFITLVFTLIISSFVFSQTFVEGYVFETGNRGFVKDVSVTLVNLITEDSKQDLTDESGKYRFEIDPSSNYAVIVKHELFVEEQIEFGAKDIDEGETLFLSHELKREPGYIFEITLAEKNQAPDTPKDQMKGALIEVFNNTKEEVILIVDSLTVPDFKIDLKKGNHYTILVRHPDFLSKRMEAFVDVEGCILCFEGIGDVRPGVSDNLTENNNQGTLLANVELEKFYEGKIIRLPNIYYEYNSAHITNDAAIELDKAAGFINDNPNILVELSSHTDSRGRAEYNKELSQKRSESAVRYLLDKGNVNPNQIEAIGYGEEKLLNNCSDGIECVDKQHKDNRRTELKLLNIVDNVQFKSLATMKREEKFERMLAEIEFGGGQIKVSSEDDLPKNVSESPAPLDEKISNESAIKANSTNVMIEDNVNNDGDIEISVLKGSESIEEKSNIKDSFSETSTTGTKTGKEANSGIAQFRELERYTGFKLVVHFSRFELPIDHPLLIENEDIVDFVTRDNNHLYMIGDFKTRKEAMNYLLDSIRDKYPTAYLVGFEDGIRVE